MRASRFNHVSVQALDLEESVRFYVELFGAERIPTPKFPHTEDVVWLKLGDQQLHLFKKGGEAPVYHHFGVDVDDFEAMYLRVKELGLLDGETFAAKIWEHPAGWLQMYIRDPAGNLVEIDWPDPSTVDRSVVTEIQKMGEAAPQTGDAAVATLYLGR